MVAPYGRINENGKYNYFIRYIQKFIMKLNEMISKIKEIM